MHKLFSLLAVLLCLCVIYAPTYAQEATAEPDAGWPVEERCKDSEPLGTIAYVSNENSAQQIYKINVDGTDKQTVSALVDANIEDIDWSPDGKQIAFTNNYHIYRLNIETKASTQLTANPRGDYHPAWSPDGRYIAYITTRSGPFDIWLMKPNGANLRQMTSDPRWELTVRWSPNGESFGYVPNSGANLQIWIEKDGLDEIFMHLEDNDDMVFHTVTDFRWSPNGQYFSIQSDSGAYVVNRDGSNLRQIADRETFGYDAAPSWSPDSCFLTFRLDKGDESGIYVMDLYDGSRHKIPNVLPYAWSPVWKPKEIVKVD